MSNERKYPEPKIFIFWSGNTIQVMMTIIIYYKKKSERRERENEIMINSVRESEKQRISKKYFTKTPGTTVCRNIRRIFDFPTRDPP
jgi:hypothetical protein